MKKIMSYTRAGYILAPFCSMKGFTLLEILVVVLIISILGAIMLPQYQRAVLKSRYAGLMPIAKAMADSNEAYFLEHGNYADNAQDLPVQGRQNYPDGTELEFGTSSDYSYVLATNPGVANNTYVVYQKHSENFADNIHCEALTTDEQANQVCLSFGGTPLEGSVSGADYTAYLLSGNTTGSQFPKQCTTPPDTQQACSGCGFMTRQATCNTKTGEWEYDGEFDPDTCPDKPNPEQGESCGTGYTGNLTRAATCSDDHSAWEYVGEWSRSACEEIPTCTGDQPANTKAACEKGYSGTMMGSYSCKSGEWVVTWDTSTCVEANGKETYNYSRATHQCISSETETCSGNNNFSSSGYGGGTCVANTEGSCIGNTYATSAKCQANAEYTCSGGTYSASGNSNLSSCEGTSDNSCTNNTFGGYSYCAGSGDNSCSGNTFTTYASCSGTGINSCNGNIFSANGKYSTSSSACDGQQTGACSNNTFSGKQAVCYANTAGSCLNNIYENGGYCQGSSCPAGSPVYWTRDGIDRPVGIQGCHSGTGTTGRQYCPAGMVYDNKGPNGTNRCHDGNGNFGPEYCN